MATNTPPNIRQHKVISVADARKAVKRANESCIPPTREALFLPLPEVAYRVLDTNGLKSPLEKKLKRSN